MNKVVIDEIRPMNQVEREREREREREEVATSGIHCGANETVNQCDVRSECDR